MRRFAGTIRDKIDLGELSIWYDASDEGSIIKDGSNNVTQINNKGTLPNGEMIYIDGGAIYELNVYNGKNAIRGTGSGMRFQCTNALKANYTYLHSGQYSAYFVFKIFTNTDRLMGLFGNSAATSQTGFRVSYEGRPNSGGIIFNNTFEHIIHKSVPGESSLNAQNVFSLLPNNLNVFTSIIRGENSIASFYKNESSELTRNQNTVNSNESTNILSIGNLFASIDTRFLGDLCEIMIYKENHNEDQRVFTRDYLINKWGINI